MTADVRDFRRAVAFSYWRLWFGVCLSSRGSGLVLQPALSDCLFLDFLSPLQDFPAAAVVDIGGLLHGRVDDFGARFADLLNGPFLTNENAAGTFDPTTASAKALHLTHQHLLDEACPPVLS